MTKVWCANLECCENKKGVCTIEEIHLHAESNPLLNCHNYQE